MKTISEVASGYIGKEEIRGNLGFKDEVFASKMKDVGFQPKQAWCSYFGELCACEAKPLSKVVLEALFDASAVKTLNNFKKAGYQVEKEYIPGAVNQIVVWQLYIDGVAQWQGHLAIPSEGDDTHFFSIEGNTDDGKGVVREGYIVAKKRHEYLLTPPAKGHALVILGFVNLDSK